jgi:hypothetical protein
MTFLLNHLAQNDLPFLLIGGRALEAYGYVRSTRDLDLLIRADDLNRAGELLREIDYLLLAETAIFSRWRSRNPTLEDLDLLYVDQATFAKLTADAVVMTVGNLEVQTPSLIGMIALKLHAMRSNPERRSRDLQDVQEILRLHPGAVSLEELRRLCEKYGPLGILHSIEARNP